MRLDTEEFQWREYVRNELRYIASLQYRILTRQELQMDQLNALNSAVTRLNASVDALIAKGSSGVPPADVQAAADALNAIADKVDAAAK